MKKQTLQEALGRLDILRAAIGVGANDKEIDERTAYYVGAFMMLEFCARTSGKGSLGSDFHDMPEMLIKYNKFFEHEHGRQHYFKNGNSQKVFSVPVDHAPLWNPHNDEYEYFKQRYELLKKHFQQLEAMI